MTGKERPLRGLKTALQTLTILPVPGRGSERLVESLPWFPLVGVLLGLLVVLAGRATFWVGAGWSSAAGFVMVLAGIVLTRALHLDGLSDWADGFWGGFDRERVLAIMKDSSLGTFGTVALLCVLLGKWVALTRLVECGGWIWIIGAFTISRTMQVVLAAAHPYARSTEGTGSPFVTQATVSHAVYALLGSAVLLAVVFGPHLVWVPVLAGAWGTTRLFGAWCVRRVGGVTGDLLGACSELTELLVLSVGGILVGT